MKLIAPVGIFVTVVVPLVSGIFWLDDRHAHQDDLDRLVTEFGGIEGDVIELASWVKKQAEVALKARLKVDNQIKQNELDLLKTLGRCGLPEYKKLCALLQRQLNKTRERK